MNRPVSKPSHSDPMSPGYDAGRVHLAIYARRYASMILRRWPILLVCIAAGLGISIYKAATTRDFYLSYSIVGVAPRVQSTLSSQIQYQEAVENFYSDQVARMNSPSVLARTARKVAEEFPALAGVQYTAKAVRGEGSQLRMNVQSTDFAHARSFAIHWAKEFKASKEEEKDSAMRAKASGTREQLLRTEESSREVKSKILAFMQEHNIASIKDFTEAAQQRLDALIGEYNQIKIRRQRIEALTKEDIASGALQEPARNPADRGGSGGSNRTGSDKDAGDPLAKFASESEYSRLKFELHSKQVERESWLKTLKPMHPKVVELDRDLAQLQSRLEYALDMVRQKQEALLKSLRSQEGTYPEQIDELQRQVREYAAIMHDYTKLTDEEKRLETEKTGLTKLLSELESSIHANEEQWKIEESGGGSPAPINAHRGRLVFTGFLTGLAAALALIYLLHRLDDRLDLAEDIERELEEPVLGQIPQMEIQGAGDQRILLTNLPPENMFAESIRGVRSTVLMALGSGPSRILLVTSAVPGDGKTTFTSNFAMTLAVTGARVLLIDADLRRGSAHMFFNQHRDTGLSDALEGRAHWSEVVKDTSHPNLKIITTGYLPDGPGELIVGSGMARVLEEAKRAYDFVIVDTPPLTGINDTFAMVRQADGLIFVLRAGQTSIKFAKTALAAVRQREARILGVVLNGITPNNPYYYYHYYYHAYYSKAEAGRPITDRVSTGSAGRRVEAPNIGSGREETAAVKMDSVTAPLSEASRVSKIDLYKARRAGKRVDAPSHQDSAQTLPEPSSPEKSGSET